LIFVSDRSAQETLKRSAFGDTERNWSAEKHTALRAATTTINGHTLKTCFENQAQGNCVGPRGTLQPKKGREKRVSVVFTQAEKTANRDFLTDTLTSIEIIAAF